MKKIAKILIAVAIVLLVVAMVILDLKKTHPVNPGGITPVVDTTMYTDVVIINNSELDSVQVFVTLQGSESIVGLFGMDSSNITTYCIDSIPCKGTFWAKKGVPYHLGDTSSMAGAIITFGADNQACSSAISNGWTTGINNFEFTVNTWYQGGKVIGANESFDITLVDGVNSILKQTATSTGPRADTLSPNFMCFWDFGVKDSLNNLVPFLSSENKPFIEENHNIPGVFPHGCDWCYKQFSPPPTCFPIKCSDKWGQVNSCQTNRPGQGGMIICEFLGFVPEIAEK